MILESASLTWVNLRYLYKQAFDVQTIINLRMAVILGLNFINMLFMHTCTGKERLPLFGPSLELSHLEDLQYRNLNAALLPISEVELCDGNINMHFGVKMKNEVMAVKDSNISGF